MNIATLLRGRAPDDYGPGDDLEMEVSHEGGDLTFWACRARFQIDAAYVAGWQADGEYAGWECAAGLLTIRLNGLERSREWLADAIGEDAVARMERAAEAEWLRGVE